MIEVQGRSLGIDGTTEVAILAMVIENFASVRAGDDEHRAVIHTGVVEHDACCRYVVVGVGVKGPVLVPLDRRSKMWRLHVEFGVVKADVFAQ